MAQVHVSTAGPTLVQRLTVFLHALMFVAGFSLVFTLGWGGTVTLVGQLFAEFKPLMAQIGGAVIIVFGLATMGIIRLPWVYYADTRPQWQTRQRSGLLASALMGVFFAAGWTPCIGATLGAILNLGFSQQQPGQAIVLSSGYALGLGIPFLVIGLAMDRASQLLRPLRKHLRKIEILSGALLTLIGLMMLTNNLTLIAAWAQRAGLLIDLPASIAATPTYPIAIAAGLLSFLSPCVLPLVPAYVTYLSGHALGSVQQTPGN